MSKSRKVVSRAAIGAATGGTIVSLFVVVNFQPRFIADALMVLGTGGLVGGAVCGAFLGMFGEKFGAAVGGVIGGIAGCVIATLGILLYTGVPWPSPRPYPGVETHIDWGGGSWGPARVQTYTVTLPLDEVQQYYEGQMNRYCENAWAFSVTPDPGYSFCRRAECKIRRLWLEQYFDVRLCSDTAEQTVVTQVDFWED